MAYEIKLPKSTKQKEEILNNIIKDGEQSRHIQEVSWWIAHYYLQGVRNFTNINYLTGSVDADYFNTTGMPQFKYEDIVAKFQTQVGRMMQMDIRPVVSKRSMGLEDLRKASISQVVLDEAIPETKINQLKSLTLPPLVKYGTVGLVGWEDAKKQMVGIDVAMPWELLPIPANPMEQASVHGVARVRTVPIDWIQSLTVTPGAKDKVYQEMNKQQSKVGTLPGGTTGSFTTHTEQINMPTDTARSGTLGTGRKSTDKTRVDMVKLVEVYLESDDGNLEEYIMLAGDKYLYHKNYNDMLVKRPMPIHIIRDIPTGGFWGRGSIALLISFNTELEYTIGRAFQNVQDIDTYGILLTPTTLGIPTDIMRGDDGLKRISYEPDYTGQDIRPTNILPVNSGSMPSEVIKIGAALADKIANQPTELMRGDAPGRVDSQAGLGFLYEVSNTPLTATAQSISSAFSGVYKAILGMTGTSWPKERVIQISMLDDTLAGVKIDPKSGQMALEENAIPDPNEVRITTRTLMPKSLQQEKMELQEALKLGTIDMFEFRTMVRKKGIDLPVGNDAEWQNYRRAMMENITLFGDGKTTGQILFSETDIHEIHIRVLQPFMARPEYYLAATVVRDAFKEHYEMHLMAMGALPEGAPQPEEAAEEGKAMEQLQPQGGGFEDEQY